MSGRYRILVLILAAQTMANVGPLGIPTIAALIRQDLGLTLPQAGSFLSLYDTRAQRRSRCSTSFQ